MSIRDMKDDPGIWEKLSWADMSSKEKELWTILGWQQATWDRNEAPASADKYWNELNSQEQSAAMTLGFTMDAWNTVEDE